MDEIETGRVNGVCKVSKNKPRGSANFEVSRASVLFFEFVFVLTNLEIC